MQNFEEVPLMIFPKPWKSNKDWKAKGMNEWKILKKVPDCAGLPWDVKYWSSASMKLTML